MGLPPWYTTREVVKSDLDIEMTARVNAEVDRCIAAASRSVEGFLRRRFYPEFATRYFDWPNADRARSGRLWLDEHFLISATEVVSGGVVIASGDVIAYPDGDPPYDRIELNSSGSSTFTTDGTAQNSISITGLWGESDEQDPAGALDAAVVSTSATSVTVTASAAIGVGSLLKVGTERMIVTARRMSSTGETLVGALNEDMADQTLPNHDPTAFAEGDVIMVDAERMRVDEITGTTIVVTRAVDGTSVAAHLNGATVYAPRLLTVARGAVGSTPATHLDGATVSVWHVPDLVHELATAEAMVSALQKLAGYARTIGSGDNQREAAAKGLADVRDRARLAYGRLLNG